MDDTHDTETCKFGGIYIWYKFKFCNVPRVEHLFGISTAHGSAELPDGEIEAKIILSGRIDRRHRHIAGYDIKRTTINLNIDKNFVCFASF